MGRMQRNKGRAGEQELVRLLVAELGTEFGISRNLGQTRDSGCDIPCGTFDIEAKRGQRPQLGTWCREARERAAPGRLPVVAHRANGEPWRFYVVLDLPQFAELARELSE